MYLSIHSHWNDLDEGKYAEYFDFLTAAQLPIVWGWQLLVRRVLADLSVSKRPGTSNRIEIHFAVFNHLYLSFSPL